MSRAAATKKKDYPKQSLGKMPVNVMTGLGRVVNGKR